MLTITKDLREWLPDDVIGAVMEVQVQTIVFVAVTVYMRTSGAITSEKKLVDGSRGGWMAVLPPAAARPTENTTIFIILLVTFRLIVMFRLWAVNINASYGRVTEVSLVVSSLP